MSDFRMLSQEQLDDIRGNLRIYDNRVCERDVVSLLRHIAALEAEFAAAKAECERLRVALRQIIAASENHVGRNGSYYAAGESDGLRTAAYIAGQALSQEERQ